ncbi:HepT-like ribonuclease domain-containing protein [Candidatus Methylomirabilis sp.]|uniref:type VII toxin-antitoxin system HepT family RNase toxin n=1 Tax=Candidatus Methylomirabilis sp. TaxID=2032687 RepID=UPI0030761F33
MAELRREIMERKLSFLRQFLADLDVYARLDSGGRQREHYAIERLLQLLCESAADIGLQFLKARGYGLASSYREVFEALAREGILSRDLAQGLIEACAMRNLLTHLYETIDPTRVAAAIEPALDLYRRYLRWALAEIEKPA